VGGRFLIKSYWAGDERRVFIVESNPWALFGGHQISLNMNGLPLEKSDYNINERSREYHPCGMGYRFLGVIFVVIGALLARPFFLYNSAIASNRILLVAGAIGIMCGTVLTLTGSPLGDQTKCDRLNNADYRYGNDYDRTFGSRWEGV
jgi:hypothetical protein